MVRRAVLDNPKTPLGVIRELARDVDSQVRLGVASGYRVPNDVLRTLSEVGDERVRSEARRRLHEWQNPFEDLLIGSTNDADIV